MPPINLLVSKKQNEAYVYLISLNFNLFCCLKQKKTPNDVRVVYSSERGGERNKIRAAIEPRPKISKKGPPKSSELVAIS